MWPPPPDPSPFPPDTTDPLVILGGDDEVLVAIHADGTVTIPDPDRVTEAAVIFWRQVLEVAITLGIPIRVREIPQTGSET